MTLQTSDASINRSVRSQPLGATWTPTAIWLAGAILAVWAVVAYGVGVTGLAATDNPGLLRPIVLTAAVPVALFALAYVAIDRFRHFVLAQDIRWLTMLQAWRVIGFGFILLYAHQVLPGWFAWPAAVGDVLIGLTAPLMVARLERDPAFATSRRFLLFNIAGLLDFAVAVVMAGLTAGAIARLISDGVTSAPMEVWPLSLFPSLIVPVFIMLHVTVLLKVRALAASRA